MALNCIVVVGISIVLLFSCASCAMYMYIVHNIYVRHNIYGLVVCYRVSSSFAYIYTLHAYLTYSVQEYHCTMYIISTNKFHYYVNNYASVPEAA